MTHKSEQSFEDYVVAQLEDKHGEDAVHRQYYLPSGRYVDILVADPDGWTTHAYELENNAGSVLNGGGQASYYAAEVESQGFENAVPVLAVPADHIDDEERRIIRQTGVLVREIGF